MLHKTWFALLGLMSFLSLSWGQPSGIPFIQNDKPREYKASSANYDVVQDGRGIMYFANYRGVLEYDGVHWRLFPLPNGTPVRSLGVDSLGQVYVSGLTEMGYLAPDSLGRLIYQSLLPLLDTTFHQLPEQIQVLGTKRGAWFRGNDEGQLYRWTGDSLLHFPVTHSGRQNTMFLLGEKLWVQNSREGLLRWEESHFVEIPGSEQLQGYRFLAVTDLGNDSFLAFDNKKGFVLVQMTEGRMRVESWKTEIDQLLEEEVFSGLFRLRDGRIGVTTVKAGLHLLSSKGEASIHLTDEVGLQDNLVFGTYQDRQGTLWLALSKGISRVDISAPITQWNESSGLKGIVFSARYFQGRLYASTTLGVYMLDKNRFWPVEGISTESWNLVEAYAGGKNRLLVTTVRGLYEIEGLNAVLVPGAIGVFKLLPSRQYPGNIFTLSAMSGLETLMHDGKSWIFPDDGLRISGRFGNLVETAQGELWLQEVLNPQVMTRYLFQPSSKKIDSTSVKSSQVFRLPSDFPTPQGIFSWQRNVAVATERGIWIFDTTANAFVPETVIGISGPDQPYGVLRAVEDAEQRLWVERYQENRRWLELAIPDGTGKYLRDSVSLKELADLEVWGEVYAGPKGYGWIGTPEGLFAFNTRAPRRREGVFRPLIRKVVSGADSVLFYGFTPAHNRTPSLPYHNNSITFHFAAPYYKSDSEVQYSYLLEGWDQAWSPWRSEFKKDYTLLPPGNYVFRVKARNLYAQESAESAFAFHIDAPWYRTKWAFLGYFCCVGLLVYGTVKLNTKRLHVQNEHLEKIVYERTSEIWAQHKEIIRKTAELKRQKEAIAEQHELLGDKNQELESALSKLKSAQSKLVESEKMASLGQLTAGIAHEINNPINFVKGNISPLKRDFEEIRELFARLQQIDLQQDLAPQLDALKAYCMEIDAPFLFEEMALLLQGIEEGAQRTKQIVDGLKVFSRSDTDTFKMADVHMGLEATLTLLGNSIKDRFAIHRNFGPIPQIECMPGKLNQVFLNILSNAVQAMEEQAGPEAQLRKGKIGDIFLRTREWVDQGQKYVQIDIGDSGPGIPEHIRNKIFDPFFTTKDVGKGTGLGLSITFGIIDNHGGNIEVLSSPSGGALFRITLPQKQPEAALSEIS